MLQSAGNNLLIFLLSFIVGTKKPESKNGCLWKCDYCNAVVIINDLKNSHCPTCGVGSMVKYVEEQRR